MAGAPTGNQNASKAKLVSDCIRRAIVQDDGQKLREGVDKLLDAFASGEPWAIEQVTNRLEGKPAQATEITGPGEGGAVLIQTIRRVIVDPKP